ncbi:hypothetical protein AZI11_06730 [Levilactobacillus brevis]|uniref:DUF6287 domain-containing protein n=1 Tax=Levilactobacillus brevis TaxID=1580 RepID=UPI000A203992|nr:DUF6287 domain-containing protein [Levilactobacillus brevis]ARN92611.1 hypothetical protein AZI11_06730 [Levilactobacillus brevis]
MTTKRLITLTLLFGTLGTLAACSAKPEASTSGKSSTSSRVAKKSATSKQASSKASSSQPSKATTNQAMNFAQIRHGNYTSLAGEWTEVANGVNRHNGTGIQYESGGSEKLKITANRITASEVRLAGQTLTNTDGDNSPLIFKQTKQGALTASLGQEAAINWEVTFYPKHTTDDFLTQVGLANSSQNLISVWTSNNSDTQVYA